VSSAQPTLPGVITAPPTDRHDPMGLWQWCQAHGIDDRTFNMRTMYERGAFELMFDTAADRWQITTWRAGHRDAAGAWVEGCSEVVASFSELSAALVDLAQR
jgi:hypothetical protein